MKIQKIYISNFAFWGKRNYVHGSHMIYTMLDIFENVWKIGSIKKFSASFIHPLKFQGQYFLFDNYSSMVDSKNKLSAIFEVYTQKDKYYVGIEKATKKINKMVIDNEDELIKKSVINKVEQTISTENFQQDKWINVIIILNKIILSETIIEDGNAKWFMAKIDLDFNAIERKQIKLISVKLIKNIGNRITKSDIELNEKKCGEIYFNRNQIA